MYSSLARFKLVSDSNIQQFIHGFMFLLLWFVVPHDLHFHDPAKEAMVPTDILKRTVHDLSHAIMAPSLVTLLTICLISFAILINIIYAETLTNPSHGTYHCGLTTNCNIICDTRIRNGCGIIKLREDGTTSCMIQIWTYGYGLRVWSSSFVHVVVYGIQKEWQLQRDMI
eukprot:832881_1